MEKKREVMEKISQKIDDQNFEETEAIEKQPNIESGLVKQESLTILKEFESID